MKAPELAPFHDGVGRCFAVNIAAYLHVCPESPLVHEQVVATERHAINVYRLRYIKFRARIPTTCIPL